MGSKAFNWLKIGQNGLQLAQNGLQLAKMAFNWLKMAFNWPKSPSTGSKSAKMPLCPSKGRILGGFRHIRILLSYFGCLPAGHGTGKKKFHSKGSLLKSTFRDFFLKKIPKKAGLLQGVVVGLLQGTRKGAPPYA